MSDIARDPKIDFDEIARKHCEKLINSKAAIESDSGAEALIMLAFTYGAAWALDLPDVIDMCNAQIEANQTALNMGLS